MAYTHKDDATEAMHIDIVKDGPYLVHGSIPLSRARIVTDETGAAVRFEEVYRYPLQETYALCRCGGSQNKPFCDGTHVKIGFESRSIAPHTRFMSEAQEYSGDGVTLYDAPRYCIGARFCDRGAGAWALTTESTYGSPEQEMAIDEAELCPSGRLVIVDDAEENAYEVEYEPSIVLIEDPTMRASSSIWVRGEIPIFDEEGKRYEIRNRVTLCRCGRSRDMPFCDGTHYQMHFDDGHIND